VLPDDNGEKITQCGVAIGGAWEWAANGFGQDAFNDNGEPLVEEEAVVSIPATIPPF
jgi:hypothetical protein